MAVRTYVANQAVITARRDGWVEVRQRARPARALDRDEYFAPREFYRPTDIHEWAIRARATADTTRLNHARPTTDTLGKAPQHLIISGTSHRVIAQDGRFGLHEVTSSWITVMHGCDRPLTWQASNFAITFPRSAADHEFIAQLDSAATIAESARNKPVDHQQSAPFNQSEVSCILAPYGLRMPTRIATVAASAPLEVMARFIVTKSGLVDVASVEFYPELNGALLQRAIAAMKQWRVTGRRGGEAIDFRMHHPVIFFDSLRSDNHTDISGFRDAFLLTLRADGLLEQRGGLIPGQIGETGHIWSRTASVHAIGSREVFRAADARRWLNDVNRMRDSASHVPIGSQELPDINEARRPGDMWRVQLGNPMGRRLTARFFRSPDTAQSVGMELELSACASDATGSLLSHSVWSEHGWNHMVRVVDSSLALHPTASIDSNRVYGELEVTCVAKPHDAGMPSRATREDSIATSLALHEDALVTFIVDRFGNVDRTSIHAMGKWRAADRSRIASAISGLRYTPATFAGVRVAQRAHLLIPAAREQLTQEKRPIARATGRLHCHNHSSTINQLPHLRPLQMPFGVNLVLVAD
jgi:hypothetical protein